MTLIETPVRPDQPAGDAATYEPEYETIKGEIEKLDSVTGAIPDWDTVIERAAEILGGKSKDLTVASYLTLALFRQHGYTGLADGLAVSETLLEKYWEDLFPEKKRMRGRVSAVNWLNERAGAAVERTPPGTGQNEQVERCAEAFNKLQAKVDEKFGSDAPVMADLRRALEAASREAAPPAATAAPQPAAAAPAAAPARTVVDSVEAAIRVIEGMTMDARRAVDYLVRNEPSSPVPYLITRGLAWSLFRELPPEKDGTTMLPSPDPGLFEAWDRMASQADWSGLLEDTEWRVLTTPLCLDINYYVAQALSGMGYDDAREAMVGQCLAFVRRLPRLIDLAYQDGRPLASDATRAWLAAEGASRESRGDGAGAGSRAAGPAADPLKELSRQATALAKRGKLADAIQLVQEGIDQQKVPRERFRLRFLLAEICLEAGQLSTAAVVLEALDQEFLQRGLEEWEPELALGVLRTFYLCEKKLGQKGQRDPRESVQRLDRLYGRLCRLDLATALALESKR